MGKSKAQGRVSIYSSSPLSKRNISCEGVGVLALCCVLYSYDIFLRGLYVRTQQVGVDRVFHSGRNRNAADWSKPLARTGTCVKTHQMNPRKVQKKGESSIYACVFFSSGASTKIPKPHAFFESR